MELTTTFYEQVREAWGNPRKVADAAFNELFRHDDIGLDHDDQVDYAKKIGLLAGLMKERSLNEFIAAFNKQVLNE